jgi:hypothetical protein
MAEFRTRAIALETVNLKILPSDLVRLKKYKAKDESLTRTFNRLLNQVEGKDEA